MEESIKKNLQIKLVSFLSKYGEQKTNIENKIEGGNKGSNLTDNFKEWLKSYPLQLIILGIMIVLREELEGRTIENNKKKTSKNKKIMFVLNTIKELKTIFKQEFDLRYKATQIMTTLLWLQD